jgi:trehalose 6-phosphate synthase
MGHCDLVGFQTEIDAANFPRDLRKECGMLSRDPYTFQAADRTVRIGIFPVGVSVTQSARRLSSETSWRAWPGTS